MQDSPEQVLLKDIQEEIFGVLVPGHVRGYIFLEASALHHVEKLIGISGMTTTRLKNCRKVLPGVSPLENTLSYLEPKAATAGIEEGCIIEISGGAFKDKPHELSESLNRRKRLLWSCLKRRCQSL